MLLEDVFTSKDAVSSKQYEDLNILLNDFMKSSRRGLIKIIELRLAEIKVLTNGNSTGLEHDMKRLKEEEKRLFMSLQALIKSEKVSQSK